LHFFNILRAYKLLKLFFKVINVITVNVIKDGEITTKKDLELPKEIRGVIKCKNPRCITSIEQELPHIFVLTDPKKEVYRCKYCEEKYGERV
ncbi:MAG: hypothetical protein IIV45_06365, partial [Lachnospiraceae bacterium]|nr:hypothetical protein [Lachnospiraceae bacterium]